MIHSFTKELDKIRQQNQGIHCRLQECINLSMEKIREGKSKPGRKGKETSHPTTTLLPPLSFFI